MKKIGIGIALATVLGIGGVLTVANVNDEPKTETVTGTETPVQQEIPTERTVELAAGANYPWEGLLANEAGELVDKGETVYLLSDLEPFEEAFIRSVDIDLIANGQEPGTLKQYTDQLVKQLSPYKPDMQPYWDALTEAGNLTVQGQYDEAKAKIEEAKTLRAE